MSVYITPRGLLDGAVARAALAAGAGWPFLRERAFALAEIREGTKVQVLQPGPSAQPAPVATQVSRLGEARAPFCGLALDQPRIMGVVNVTPDSFSDGGRFAATEQAIQHGIALAEAGAAIIDVGGESTRPGSSPVNENEELARAIPVVKALAARGLVVSIDSRKPRVMAAALEAGARIVNDITALRDPESFSVIARSGACVVLMHMQGEPRTMQDNPTYVWAPGDIYDFFTGRIAACAQAGIAPERIAVDPGLGFGKNDAHNADILNHLALFHGLGCPMVLGASRKGFLGRAGGGAGTADRLPGSLACALHGASQGVQILRVHDVKETRQALMVAGRILAGAR